MKEGAAHALPADAPAVAGAFVDTTEPAVSTRPTGVDAVGPATRPRGVDYAALWRQVEAESARVVVIDLERRAIVAGRLMSDSGDKTARVTPESPLERLFPDAGSQVEAWSAELAEEPGAVLTHGLSPRHWAYFWRVDATTALLAVVHHRFGRGAVAAGDTATICLLCEHWLTPELQALGIGRGAQSRWNRVDRRARPAAPPALWGALAALGLATACGLWLAAGTAAAPPAVVSAPPPAELQRLERLADETLRRSLAHSLSYRDYGEAQEAMDAHLALGHFTAAVLLNDRQQVVAHAGLAPPPVVGQPLAPAASAALGAGVKQVGLLWEDAQVGQLLTAPGPAAPPAAARATVDAAGASPDTARRVVGALLALAGLASGATLWRHLRARFR